MKLVFIHSGGEIRYDDEGNRYTSGGYTKEVWDVYLSVFSEITVVMKAEPNCYPRKAMEKRYNLLPECINFISIPNRFASVFDFFSLRERRETRKKLYDAVKAADAVINRLPGICYATRIANELGKKNLVEVVGCTFDAYWNHGIKGKVLAVPFFLKMRKTVKKAENVVYVSENFLQQRYPTSGRSIHCSDVRLLRHQRQVDDELRLKNKSNGTRFVIGTAGAVNVKYKGQQFVIRALGKLKRKGIDCIEYQIAGPGDSTYLKNMAVAAGVESQVVFVGNIKHDNVFEWYKSLDMYIQPSLTEGLPRSLVEAMSCGIPCAGTRVGGIPELLDASVLFPKRSCNTIAKIIQKIIDEGDFATMQSERNIKKSHEYDADVLTDRRVRFMRQVLC